MKRILLLLSSILVMFACSKEQNDTSIKAVAVTGISLNKTSLSLTEGDEYPLVPTIAPSNASDKSVTWSSDNEAIVMVSSEGLVKAMKAGKATVTATTIDGGKKASCSVDVAPKTIAVTGATISPETLEMEVGEQKILSASVTPENATNKNITFVSSKESVATVSQEGIVEGIAVGNAIVTATTEDGNFKAHCTVTVKDKVVHVTGITLNKTSLSLTEGEESTLVPTITPSNATDKSVTWSSDNEAIVTVSSEGLVKALKAGKATVTATTVDGGEKASCSVEVSQGMGAVTGSASHISCRNAEISGQAILSGTTATDLTFGVLYSTSSGVLIGTATKLEAKTFDADYKYTVNPGVLEPETTYYYRSYISQNSEITYGELKSFKTLAVSSMIQTAVASDINPKDAVLNADLDLTDCKYDALEYGFEVTPSGGSAYKVKSTNLSQKKYSAKAESLKKNSEYSYTAYVTLDGRTYKGEAKSFTTASIQASVTVESSNVSYYTATISGKLTVKPEGTFTKSAALYYSSTATTLDALKSSGTKKTLTLGSDGSYSIDLLSLVPDTKYYYVVESKVDDIELKTEVKNFTTLKIQASVTAETSNVSYLTATISGKLTVTSEGTFTKSAVLYYSSTATTLDALKSSGRKKTLTLKSDGSYSIDLSSLVSDTKYYYVVVSNVDDIELKTEVKNFTTLKIQASVTAETSNVSYLTATISGKLTVTSEGTFTKSAVLFHSSTATTLNALKSSGTKQKITLNPDGTYSTDVNGLAYNAKIYYCVVAKVDDVEFASSVNNLTTKSLPTGPVDMGLSVKWASVNIGATNPWDSGRYFAWGDVTGQTWNGSSWSGSGFPYGSYPTYEVDSNNNLKPAYDAAHVNLGGSWRMPTHTEQQELIDNCTCTWTTINGVNGRLFTSKKTGYTDKSIFLPAAGGGNGTNLYNAGSGGRCWSSTLGSGNTDNAYYLYFYSSDVLPENDFRRYFGFSVRPVTE